MSNDRKSAWDKNLKKIRETYPSVAALEWGQALGADHDIFAQVLGDVLKSEGKRSRPGKRPTLDRAVAEAELQKLTGVSYSELPFREAFKALTFGRSIRNIAHKTGIQKDHVHRLLRGDIDPTLVIMEKVATAFRKDPSYFLEYRTAVVLMAIDKYLSEAPETSTVWYLKLKGK